MAVKEGLRLDCVWFWRSAVVFDRFEVSALMIYRTGMSLFDL